MGKLMAARDQALWMSTVVIGNGTQGIRKWQNMWEEEKLGERKFNKRNATS